MDRRRQQPGPAAIEDLAGIYSLVGVHCLDLACDSAVVAAARRGRAWAATQAPPGWRPPWLMVSLNDGADPHFRKAWFDPQRCPESCRRPCAAVCPALAIPAQPDGRGGVLAERCYGCGRCLPVCPFGLIEERQTLLEPAAVAARLAQLRPDAIELHTRLGRQTAFEARLAQVQAAAIPLRRLAVSCGLEACADGPERALSSLSRELWQRFHAVRRAGFRPLWQLDGRPMSGDIGASTAAAAVRLLRRLAAQAPPRPAHPGRRHQCPHPGAAGDGGGDGPPRRRRRLRRCRPLPVATAAAAGPSPPAAVARLPRSAAAGPGAGPGAGVSLAGASGRRSAGPHRLERRQIQPPPGANAEPPHPVARRAHQPQPQSHCHRDRAPTRQR